MVTLKDHQQAMVDLLASGSGIPASASRLAHAMHDVLSAILAEPDLMAKAIQESKAIRMAYTTPGLNDKALAADVETCQIKLTGAGAKPKADLFDRSVAAERRVKELENTVRQLRASNAKLRIERDNAKDTVNVMSQAYQVTLESEQAGCRKDDTQVCEHTHAEYRNHNRELICLSCGKDIGV